jgi:anti-sigma-K factor RskA
MIDEATQERACLFVLGLLPPDEAADFQQHLGSNDELRALTAGLNNATVALAKDAPAQMPPAELKARILGSLAAYHEAKAKVTPFPQRKVTWVPWAAAAALAGLFSWQAMQTTAAKQREDALAAELKQRETAWRLKDEARSQDLALSQRNAGVLQEKLNELEQRDVLSQAQIAVLGSLLKDQPKAVAVSLWDQQKQNGLLVVENLPALAPGKDYQLWVIDPAIPAPVSAGVFKVDAQGKMKLSFKPTAAIQTAGKFAITEEAEGGVASPTMDKMVVIGGF